MDFTTGNNISDRVAEINITGNVIPSVWFKTVVNDKGKPYLLAIMILSEIVYWYRPVEVRDENTGEFLGYRTKFSRDLLQKSYKDLAEYYQVSKRQVTDAVIALEKLGVIKRNFRTIEKNGVQCNNVLFIELNPDKLRDLTYPHECKKEKANVKKGSSSKGQDRVDKVDDVDSQLPLSRKNVIGYPKKTGQALTEFRETNTENTIKTTDTIFNNLISSCLARDEWLQRFSEQISYDAIRCDYENDHYACGILDQCVEIAATVMTSSKSHQIVGGEKRPTGNVRKVLLEMNILHMKYVIASFLQNTTKVKKIQNYLLTCMVNSVYSLDVNAINTVNFNNRGT